MLYYVTGDKHGDFHTILNDGIVKDRNNAIIILGDAGFNYYLNKTDDRLKQEIAENSCCRWYCVRGNHEARPQDTSCGYELTYDQDVRGEVYVQREYPNIRFFKDWGEYWLGDYHIAVIGGAYSVDKWWRLQRAGVYTKTDWGYNNPKKTGWFPNEQLSEKEMHQAYLNLGGGGYSFVFSHTCPKSFQPTELFLGAVDQKSVDDSMEIWLDHMKDVMDWHVYLFGHYHDDLIIAPHVEMYYHDIENLDDINERWKSYDKTQQLDWWLKKSQKFYQFPSNYHSYLL